MKSTSNMQTGQPKIKDKCHFRSTSVPFFGEVISRHDMGTDTLMLKVFTEMPPNKNELQIFLGINIYSSSFSPSSADTCELQTKLTQVKLEWN